jgi:hypothetical protein
MKILLVLEHQNLYNGLRHREGVLKTMKKIMKKFSTTILASAMVLGGMAVTQNSFAQANAAVQVATNVSINQATAQAIAKSIEMSAMAAAIIGATAFTGSAQQIAALSQALSNNTSPEATQLLAFINNVNPENAPEVVGSARKRSAFRNGLAALAVAVGMNVAVVQQAQAAVGTELFNQVAGNQIEECVTEWTDPDAQKAFVYTVAAMNGQSDVQSWTNSAAQDVTTYVFAGEEVSSVLNDRMCPAMNSTGCDIARLACNAPGARAPRASAR